ncbi:MAG TPA: group I intron-associated PD-(D/E)XK endonuclease [Terriglobales bacterium]|nr:group I intron-associated PD-(D/E)XK endonuclease [Terriglobales bacterium]
MSLRLPPKLQGEAAESVFLARAVSLGLTVCKPWGDSAKYDFVVDNGCRLFRTQVKSVSQLDGDSYRITSGSGNRAKTPYTGAQIDLLAAYVQPFDTWYLIPVEAFTPATTIRLCPHRTSRRKFERFREAWMLLQG